MNRMIYLIIGLLIIGIIAWFFFRPKPKKASGDFFISTQGQSNERVKSLNLDGPSEDASHILDSTGLSIPDIQENENAEYKADPGREWVIDLVLVDGGHFKKEDLLKIFDYPWRSKFESTIYGFSPVDNSWTYAFAGDTPETYSKIQIAISLQQVYNDENPNYDPKKLERYSDELEKRIKQYPAKLAFKETEPVGNAIAKAKVLVQLYQEFTRDAIIVLQSDNAFNGLQAWDALQSVGLTWGDGDLFHWTNYKSRYGHDRHFSVWTTTEPGYFFPEEIKDGNMNPANLVFGFSVPRSADPKNIFDAMLNAVKYCQKRLGGQILDNNGQPFNEENEKKELAEFIGRMKLKGIIPGSDNALMMY